MLEEILMFEEILMKKSKEKTSNVSFNFDTLVMHCSQPSPNELLKSCKYGLIDNYSVSEDEMKKKWSRGNRNKASKNEKQIPSHHLYNVVCGHVDCESSISWNKRCFS